MAVLSYLFLDSRHQIFFSTTMGLWLDIMKRISVEPGGSRGTQHQAGSAGL